MCRGRDQKGSVVYYTPEVHVHNPYSFPMPAVVAGPPPANPKCRPICLDFLRGECAKHRDFCTYAHPELHILAERANLKVDGKKVCPVYALTGFCKFGVRCHNYHPPTEIHGAFGAPPITHRMTRASKVKARQLERERNEIVGCEDEHEDHPMSEEVLAPYQHCCQQEHTHTQTADCCEAHEASSHSEGSVHSDHSLEV